MAKVGRSWRFMCIIAVALLSFAARAQAATYTVGTTDDTSGTCADPAGGTCSLRQLITYENDLDTTPSPVDTIDVPAGTYDLGNDALDVTQSVDIAGASARTTTLDQQSDGGGPVFELCPPDEEGCGPETTSPTVTISDLTMSEGTADDTYGGDILNTGDLTLSSDVVEDGFTEAGSGAGIANDGGELTVSDSLVTGNTSASSDGAGGDSGGIANIGGTDPSTPAALLVEDSTITDNTADEGGGVMSWGNADNTVQITDSTITNDTDTGVRTGQANSGGLLSYGGGQISVLGSIVALNTLDTDETASTVDCATGSGGTIVSDGYNLESGTECGFTATGDLQNADPDFLGGDPGTLENLGGEANVIPLDAASPAVDAIPASSDDCGGTDQRGTTRPQGTGCDIGAYELFQPVQGQSFTTLLGEVDALSGSTPTVDWGDGTPASNASYDTTTREASGTHTYAAAGDYDGTINYLNSDSTPQTAPFSIKVQPAPPTVTSVAPTSGPTTGGTSVTITGTYLTGATVVKFGTTNATSFTVNGATQITAAAPAGSGADDVTVTTPNGTSTRTPADIFTYVPAPAVTGVTPTSGPAAGGTAVTITGSGFNNASAVKFGSTAASAFTVGSGTQITATAPAGAGTVDITVTGPEGTSATSSADQFTYTPAPATTPPQVTPGASSVTSSSSVTLTGSVNPDGNPTVALFQYGIDPSLRTTSGPLYDQQTVAETIGANTSSQAVTATLTGLLPNALYHFQLVAVSAAGTTASPDQTFTTLEDPAPPLPTLGDSFNAGPVSGVVFIKLPPGKSFGLRTDATTLTKGTGFVPLTEPRLIPAGSQIDARAGTLQIVTSTSSHHGKRETATLSGAIFKPTQIAAGPRKGLTTMTLLENAFPGAPSYAGCSVGKSLASPLDFSLDFSAIAHAASSKSVLQTLHASDNHGKFRTKGRYSAGTVRGTVWDTTDECAGTVTTVHRGTVDVYNYGTRKTVAVHAGHSYLARAFTRRKKKH